MRFSGKVAVVTGAGSGIGRTVALQFAGEGASVALLDVNADAVRTVSEEASSIGGRCLPVVVDVSNAADVSRARDEVLSALGTPHAIVNCAGIEEFGSLFDTVEASWDRVFGVNVKGTWLVSAAFAAAMAANGGGAIVTMGSTSSTLAHADRLAYGASKGSVLMLTRAMALDGAPRNIRANCVCPGLTDTPQGRGPAAGLGLTEEAYLLQLAKKYPLGRVATPRDIANVVLFLASDDAQYMTGASVAVDGGLVAKHPLG